MQDPRGFIAKLSGFDLPDNVLKDVYIIRKYNQEFFKNVTEQYTAPEVLDTRIVTKKAEVFSFGIIMWEVWHNSIFAELYDKEEIKRKRCAPHLPHNFLLPATVYLYILALFWIAAWLVLAAECAHVKFLGRFSHTCTRIVQTTVLSTNCERLASGH